MIHNEALLDESKGRVITLKKPKEGFKHFLVRERLLDGAFDAYGLDSNLMPLPWERHRIERSEIHTVQINGYIDARRGD